MNPTEPSSYEMHKEAIKKFVDRAESAEAEAQLQAQYAVLHKEERDALQAELERVQNSVMSAFLGDSSITYCGDLGRYVSANFQHVSMELERVKKAYGERVNEINELLLERDTARKVCAEMRELLLRCEICIESANRAQTWEAGPLLRAVKEALARAREEGL